MATDAESGQAQVSDDPATAAFEALRKEVALVHRAMAGLAAERAANASPDYTKRCRKCRIRHLRQNAESRKMPSDAA